MERRVLEERRHTAALASCPAPATPQTDLPAVPTPAAGAGSARGGGRPASALDTTGGAVLGEAGVADEAGEVGLGDGAAVRGMRNDDPGGPLPPPGGTEERGIPGGARVAGAPRGGPQRGRAESLWTRLAACLDRGLAVAREALPQGSH